MNDQLIEKMITTNNETCPDIKFKNPLLDRNVAKALSKSFIDMLVASRQSTNINNVRQTILSNVRNLCKYEPGDHINVNDELSSVLSECYIENIKKVNETKNQSIEKKLDDFLMRRMSEFSYTSKYAATHNPEIIQALLNINPANIETLSNDIINWSIDSKSSSILNDIWASDSGNADIYDDVSVKMKSEIEKYMLKVIHIVLSDKDIDIEKIFDDNDMLHQLFTKSAISQVCFQMCCAIMNYVLITTNFEPKMQMFIPTFVTKVKQRCQLPSFSVLYPTHLNHIAVILDFNINVLTGTIKEKYLDMVKKYMHKLNEESENDMIMLLSHFPQWFEIYFETIESTQE